MEGLGRVGLIDLIVQACEAVRPHVSSAAPPSCCCCSSCVPAVTTRCCPLPTPPCALPLPPPAGAVALLDVRSREWPLLYANEAFAREEGGSDVEHCTSLGFWDLFESPGGGGVVS